MSLTLTLQSALSGLNAAQAGLQVTANNIANVNTVGYSRKTVHLTPQTTGNIGAGVNVDRIVRQVDEYLLSQIRIQKATTGQQKVLEQFLSQIESFFGTPGSDRTVSSALTAFKNELEAVGLTPELDATRFTAISQSVQLTQMIRDLSGMVQQLRFEADAEIARLSKEVDSMLDQIADLNAQIARASSLSTGDADLRDQRDLLLSRLSEIIDVRSIENTDGQLVLFTTSGRMLLSGTLKQSFSHTTASQLGPKTVYTDPSDPDYPGAIRGIFIGPPNAANDITNEIRGGQLKGLIETRDKLMPNLQAELDQLTQAVNEQLNALHNQGTAYPPPATLTGTQSFAAADLFSATGSVRIGVLDASGQFVDNGLGAPAVTDLALGGLNDVNDVITAINGNAALNGLVTASLTTGGKLQLTVSGGNGIAIHEDDSAVATVGASTRGFSHYFGLNDLFSGSPTGSDYSAFASAQQASSTTPVGGTSGNLTFTGNFANSPVAIAYTNAQSLEIIAASINADADLTAANIRARVINDGDGRRLVIEDADGNNFRIGDSGSLLSDKGFRVSDIGAAQVMTVKSEIATSASLLARGRLTDAALGGLTVGGNGVTMGDGTNAIALAGAFDTDLSFASAGGISTTNMSLTRYAATILSNQAAQMANVNSALDFNQQFLSNLEFRASAVSGVNLDEELAQLVVLEQSYNAAARLVAVIAQMFDELANAIR